MDWGVISRIHGLGLALRLKWIGSSSHASMDLVYISLKIDWVQLSRLNGLVLALTLKWSVAISHAYMD